METDGQLAGETLCILKPLDLNVHSICQECKVRGRDTWVGAEGITLKSQEWLLLGMKCRCETWDTQNLRVSG